MIKTFLVAILATAALGNTLPTPDRFLKGAKKKGGKKLRPGEGNLYIQDGWYSHNEEYAIICNML